MLVIDGALHPRLLPDSASLKTRNGVGVTAAGEVVFAVSKRPVRFHDFATLFRDELDCPNALFLDGTISSLYAPDINRHDRLFPMGPMIAVVGKFPR
ncbi:Phosphodiester glycosidase [compost metagenome]